MKVCHMEAMKEIRALEEEKERLLDNEEERKYVSYKEGEEKVNSGYDYRKTREAVAAIDEKVRKIKSALAKANCTVKLEGFDATIGEGLIMLAQLGGEYERLTYMSKMRQISRRITSNGILEYTECLYDVEAVAAECGELKRKIGALQIAIDRANLTSMIDI